MSDIAARVQAATAEQGFDALLLTAPASFANDSGFRATSHERLIALVVPREGPLRVGPRNSVRLNLDRRRA